MKKQDFETYQKRFRDFEIVPKFSETHVFRGTIRHPYCSFDRSAFPNHTHVISLLLIFADTCRTTELYTFHLGCFQRAIGYIICKFQFLYIFVANYED